MHILDKDANVKPNRNAVGIEGSWMDLLSFVKKRSGRYLVFGRLDQSFVFVFKVVRAKTLSWLRFLSNSQSVGFTNLLIGQQ